MSSNRRLIEVAFPLKQTSIDSVHEKNVRHGHISTLHIWPARRPLAACRAALFATLLPDPEDERERQEILEKLAGRVVQRIKRVRNAEGKIEEKIVEETEGGILHWGRESGPDLEWFREKIREAYGGRAPKVLDPFAGGGAIPLEAMRLGCEATAVDINPVAWLILKCTLEYPQKLAGKTHPLPDFALQDREFMQAFFKAQGLHGQALKTRLEQIGHSGNEKDNQLGFDLLSEAPGQQAAIPEADLAWHVRAWGHWVLAQARRELARFYPNYADFEPLVKVTQKVESRPMQLVPLNEDGTPDLDALNSEFDEEYLKDKRNPRWVAKPAVAYLWARTLKCKNCRATIPLLKTRWLCKKTNKRVVLTMQPNEEKSGVVFGIENDVPVVGNNVTERNIHDRKLSNGTVNRSGATCPLCSVITKREDIRLEGRTGKLGIILTSIVVDGPNGKEYRLPTKYEFNILSSLTNQITETYSAIPFGLPEELITEDAKGSTWCVSYGFEKFSQLFTYRQLLALGTITKFIREVSVVQKTDKKYWIEAIINMLSLSLGRQLDFSSTGVTWQTGGEFLGHTFVRFAIPMIWDFCEGNPLSESSGNYYGAVEWISRVIEHLSFTIDNNNSPNIISKSAIKDLPDHYDLIITDPPYYDAISYSAIMDFFYVWHRRVLFGLSTAFDQVFKETTAPKWNNNENDGELIDDALRHQGDRELSKNAYEEGMAKVFVNCNNSLEQNGYMVVVFANKQPDAWETLVSAIIRSGFVVVGSWPIQTERASRTRSFGSAALSTSIWLICKKRPNDNRPGWDNHLLDEINQKITKRLRDFWDVGIRGPDFVWAATGPALEAYSQYPVVKKANEPGQVMTVGEFLRHVRRMVVDFVVGRVLTLSPNESSSQMDVSGLDDVTTYYLLHRHDFGFEEAPAGACILYAVSCGLSDRELVDRYDLLTTAGKLLAKSDNGEQESEYEESSGSTFRLKGWKERKSPRLGVDAVLDKSTARLPLFPEMEMGAATAPNLPLIDQVHRLMYLWKGGDVGRVNDYLDLHGLRRNQLFQQLLQALIELAPVGSEERALLESISNHVVGRGNIAPRLF
jgi:putative DNA methylase